jgi:DinB superfamily
MDFHLEQAVAVLRRTPDVLNTMLRDLPESWTSQNEGGTSWSPFDVLGHLIHGEETDWIPRARIILEAGESRVFDVFDRHAQFEKSKGKSLSGLLDEFARLRAESLTTLSSWQLTPEDLLKPGRHPEFGAVTLGQLLATWTVHDLSHLAQISRVMCRQYTQAVGPWQAYLPILQTTAH